MDAIGVARGMSPRRRRAWEADLSREHDAKRMLMLSRQLFEQRGSLLNHQYDIGGAKVSEGNSKNAKAKKGSNQGATANVRTILGCNPKCQFSCSKSITTNLLNVPFLCMI